jgi:hypothetical protein
MLKCSLPVRQFTLKKGRFHEITRKNPAPVIFKRKENILNVN